MTPQSLDSPRQDGQPTFAGPSEGFRWTDETVLRTISIRTTAPDAEMLV